ncbi:aminoglycoside phosphotransferase (plasmid) [Pseudorhodobacter turbinis]|uniref:Aminoglycoside phosphotransferase n=1 Tax=Pseudorhodobacter turbinis TaxID=2500533 RepID=A0A4P8ELK2_9RHOB|nr:phosphotransferase [Pseudorhodobacter turbinis]QCO57879.1 aminoglycoside phosphotransferase [Pseudorhodobacter turbinis]
MAPLADLLPRLERLAKASLRLWPVPEGATLRLINVSENTTWLVEAPDFRAVLRIHRAAYHSRRGIEQELEWSQALAALGTVLTPAPIAGRDGAFVQQGHAPDLDDPRFMVMFHFAPGAQPDEGNDLTTPFASLGAIAAAMHLHTQQWQPTTPLERLIWDDEAVFGPNPTWGDWRAAPNVTPEIVTVLEQAEATVRRRLSAFGKGADRYGLIHADMRLANLLIDGATTRLIDFDDCGLGWHLYDFAAGISFIEDHPQIPALRAAWLQGYRQVRPLSACDEAEIDTFIMLRRMALLAWIGSHIEAPEPQMLAPDFAARTLVLAQRYLASHG